MKPTKITRGPLILSLWIWTDPFVQIQKQSFVTVYVDPKDPNVYWVDVDFLKPVS